jgi:hypothetical protein
LPSASITGEQSKQRSPALVQVEHRHHPELGGQGLERLGGRPGHRFGQLTHIARCRPLRPERLEGQFGEGDQLGAVRGRSAHGGEAAVQVVLFVRAGLLLDQGDAHGLQNTRPIPDCASVCTWICGASLGRTSSAYFDIRGPCRCGVTA